MKSERLRLIEDDVMTITDSQQQTSWGDLLHGYHTAMRAAGKAAGTIRLRTYYVLDLAGYVTAHEGHNDPTGVSHRTILAYMASHDWSLETRKSARGSLRSFFSWAYADEQLAHDPTSKVPQVRVPGGVPRPAPETVVAGALRTADERTALMIRIAAYAGLRAAEVAAVHTDDVQLEVMGWTLRVKGKGGKTRVVPLSDHLADRLCAIAQERPGWVFPGRDPRQHLKREWVTKLVSEALPDGWTCHTLRHRMATRAYAGTRDLLAVGAVLGHSRPETTQRYVRLPDDALFAAVRAAA